MQMERQSPFAPLAQLLNHHQRKIKIIRILHQALSFMGYKESAQELEKQSQIFFQEEPQTKLKTFFQNKKYQEVTSFLQTLHLLPEIKQEVNQILIQLGVLQLIKDKQYENAIQTISHNWPNEEERQITFFSLIAIGQSINAEEFQSREHNAIQKCIKDQFLLKNKIEQLLKSYIGSTQFDNQSIGQEQPYIKAVAESDKLSGSCRPTHIRLNPKGSHIMLVSENHKEMQVSIWSINGTKISIGLNWREQNFGKVNSACWDERGQKISICSYTKLAIFDTIIFKQLIIIESKALLGGKFLCCKWSQKGFLYAGGLADAIGVTEANGSKVRLIQPFIRAREIVLNSNNEILSISATKSLVVRFDLEQGKLLTSFEAKASFMDIYLDQKSHTLVVTNQQFIYLLNSVTLVPFTTLNSPTNQKMYKIQAFLVDNWLMIYNEKLIGVLQSQQDTLHYSWPDCDTVHIRGRKMVTARSTLVLWSSESQNHESYSENNFHLRRDDSAERVSLYSQSLQEQPIEEQESIQSAQINQDYDLMNEVDNSWLEAVEQEDEEEYSEQRPQS